MTNFEWLLKNKEDFVKDCVARDIGASKNTGEIHTCYDEGFDCHDCYFFTNKSVSYEDHLDSRKKWLDEEYEPIIPFEIGDVLINTKDGDIYFYNGVSYDSDRCNSDKKNYRLLRCAKYLGLDHYTLLITGEDLLTHFVKIHHYSKEEFDKLFKEKGEEFFHRYSDE